MKENKPVFCKIDTNSIYYFDDLFNIIIPDKVNFNLYAVKINDYIYREHSTHILFGILNKDNIDKINLLRDKGILLFVEKEGLDIVSNDRNKAILTIQDISKNMHDMIDYVDRIYTSAKANYEISDNKNKDFRV